MFFEDKYSRLNPSVPIPLNQSGIIHIYTNDDKLVLILEYDTQEGLIEFMAMRVNIASSDAKISSFSNSVIKQCFKNSDFSAIKEYFTGTLTVRHSLRLNPNASQAMKEVLMQDIHCSLPTREMFLTKLFASHKNEDLDKIVPKILANADNASRSCVIQ